MCQYVDMLYVSKWVWSILKSARVYLQIFFTGDGFDLIVRSPSQRRLCEGQLILVYLALDTLAVAKEDASNDEILMEIEKCLLSRVRADYDRSKILVGSVFSEKAAILILMLSSVRVWINFG